MIMSLQGLTIIFEYRFAATAYLLLIAVCLFLFNYYLRVNKRGNIQYRRLEKLLPGPKTVPLLGNCLDFLKDGNAVFEKLQQYTRKYANKPFRLWIGSELFVVLSDAEDIQVLFNNSLSKPQIFDTYRDVYGDCLFTCSDANSVKRRRREFAPAFNTNSILKCSTTIVNKANSIMEILKKHCNTNQPFNMWDLFPFASLDIVTKTMFNAEIDCNEMKAVNFHELNKGAINFTNMRSISSLSQFSMFDKLISGKKVNCLHRDLLNFAEKILSTKFNKMKHIYDEDIGTSSTADDEAYFSRAAYKTSLERNNPAIFYYEATAMIGAGTDTSAIIMSYILLMLSIYPNIQDKVYCDELRKIFVDDDREITVGDLEKMPYMEQIIKEALRHLNLISYVFRRAERELKIRDLTIPAGTNTMLLLFNVHYNPEYYLEPYRFNPDNFSEEAVASRPKYTFVPFAGGARDCIGKRFAMLSIKIILAKILRRFKFSTNIKIDDVKYNRNYLTTVTGNNYSVLIYER